jgi:hypothetical protein
MKNANHEKQAHQFWCKSNDDDNNDDGDILKD